MRSREFYKECKKITDDLEAQMNELFDQWNSFEKNYENKDEKPYIYVKESDLCNFGTKYEKIMNAIEYFMEGSIQYNENDRMSTIGIRRMKTMKKTILREIKTYDDYNVVILPED